MANLTTPTGNADVVILHAGFLAALQKKAVIASQTNRAYTGEITDKGSSVKLILPDLVTIADFVPGTTSIVPTPVSDNYAILTADQAKFWAVSLNDVIANTGAAGELEAVAASAGTTSALAIDAHIASVWAADAGVDLGTAVDVYSTGAAYEYILDATEALADKGDNLVALVPTAFRNQLLRDQRFAGTGFTAQYTGQIGQVAGVAIVETNVQGTDTVLIKSHAEAVASAVTLNKVERYRPQDDFSDAIKGLVVYGAKVVRPECTAAGTVIYAAAPAS